MGMSDRWISIRAVCVLLMLSASAGCGGDDDDDSAHSGAPNTGIACSAGSSFSCVGRGGCTGLQLCDDDHFLGDCVCQDDDVSPQRDAGGHDPSTQPPLMAGDASVQPPPATVDAGKPTQAAPDAGSPPAAGRELCDNGKDDDGDSDIDCADSDCKARSCAPKAPSGWTGPTLRDLGDNPHDCSGEWGHEVASGGTIADADDADCSTCKCTPDTADCSPLVDFITSADASCGGLMCTSSVGTSCMSLSSPCLGTSPSYVAGALPDSVGDCTASVQKPKVKAAEWDNHMVACAPDDDLHQGGCAEGEVCAPETPFEGETCIVKKGDHDCPSGPYKKRHVYYTGMDDTRSCSDCACGHDCSYTWQVFDAADTTCSGTPAPTEWSDSDSCTMVTPSAGTLRVKAKIDGTGSCTPTGGEPEGGVSGKNAITLCCIE
jgi:hypothetical protein